MSVCREFSPECATVVVCVVGAVLRYLMKSEGFARAQQKQLFVFMRQSFLDLVDLDLDRKNLQDFNDSDFRLIKLVRENFSWLA